MAQEDVEKRWPGGMVHMHFICKIHRRQLMNNMFRHEHPRSARSWGIAPIQKLLQRGDVHVARCDQCQFGATSWTRDGDTAPILKPTRFMSNSVVMLQQLARECPRQHKHQPLLGGRAEQVADYPLRLLKALLHGIQLTRDQTQHANSLPWDDWDVGLIMSAVPVENDDHKTPTHHQTTTDPNEPPHESDIPNVGGGNTHPV